MQAPLTMKTPRSLPAARLSGGARAHAAGLVWVLLGALAVAGLWALARQTEEWLSIVGLSALIAVGASAVASLCALPAAVYLCCFAPARERRWAHRALFIVGGLPPVAVAWFVVEVVGPASGLSAGWPLVVLGLGGLLAPAATRAYLRRLATRAPAVLQTGEALGIARAAVAWRVLVPEVSPLLWGVSLRLVARALGEAMIALLVLEGTWPLAAQLLRAPQAAGALAMLLLACVGSLAQLAYTVERREGAR